MAFFPIRVLLRSRFSPSFHFQVPPLTLTISRPYLYFYTPTTIRSLLFFYLPFHNRVKNKTKWPTAFIQQSATGTCVLVLLLLETLADPDDPVDAPHENSGASSSLHSHNGLSDGPGPKEPRRRSPSSSDRGTDISRVQPSPSKEPLQRFSMSHAERSPLLSRTLASNSLLTSLGFKKTSRLLAEETCRITTRAPTS